jgi:uncharacterized membrane protein YkvA (DUF1232 family)
MPRKTRATRPRRAAASRRRPPSARAPLLDRADVRTILYELANRLAPADVTALLQAEDDLRERARTLAAGDPHLLREQVTLALDCLHDHVAGTCPQIPYYTITLLAAAVSYFADELDVIPDFLPRIGRLDDAVVMAMAYELGREGLQRYCAWKGRDPQRLLRPSGAPAAVRA